MVEMLFLISGIAFIGGALLVVIGFGFLGIIWISPKINQLADPLIRTLILNISNLTRHDPNTGQ